jgi:hypothetical protein
MNLFCKSVISFAGVAAAGLLLALASPRTVQAFTAELVRISNTADSPAIVEDVPHLASHAVSLTAAESNEGGSVPFGEVGPDGNGLSGDFVVPAGQKFVITAIELTNDNNVSSQVTLSNSNGGFYGEWQVPLAGTIEYQYPSGIVVASGTNLQLYLHSGGAFMAIHGYLTTD